MIVNNRVAQLKFKSWEVLGATIMNRLQSPGLLYLITSPNITHCQYLNYTIIIFTMPFSANEIEHILFFFIILHF